LQLVIYNGLIVYMWGPNYADNLLKTDNFLLIFSHIVRIKQSA